MSSQPRLEAWVSGEYWAADDLSSARLAASLSAKSGEG
jgi:hypothetical protein